jgi:hypothetical protein
MSTTEDVWFAGPRKPFKSGDSIAITLPKEELKRAGIEIEEIAESGEIKLDCMGAGSELRVSFPEPSD